MLGLLRQRRHRLGRRDRGGPRHQQAARPAPARASSSSARTSTTSTRSAPAPCCSRRCAPCVVYAGLLGETAAGLLAASSRSASPFIACPADRLATRRTLLPSSHAPSRGDVMPRRPMRMLASATTRSSPRTWRPARLPRADLLALLRARIALRRPLPSGGARSRYNRRASLRACCRPAWRDSTLSRYAHFAAVFGTFVTSRPGSCCCSSTSRRPQRSATTPAPLATGPRLRLRPPVPWSPASSPGSRRWPARASSSPAANASARPSGSWREIRAHRRTDAELQRAKDRAEAANEAKSRYVAGMSHELRTPLNAILGYAQLLEHDPSIPDADGTRPCGSSAARREHLADLIESLLDISKIEAGKLRDPPGRMRTARHDRAARRDLRAWKRRERGVDFHLADRARVPNVVHADARRLRQILMNLLSNAVRYTEEGMSASRSRYRNEVATFVVEDTGVASRSKARAHLRAVREAAGTAVPRRPARASA